MAFNPFATFRKYLKYYMAGAILLCMVTFVLCSGGMRGMGLDDLLLQIAGRRGEYVLKVNGTKYYYEDINNLKNQRNLANDFIRELTKMGIERLTANISDAKKSDKLTDQDKATLPYMEACLTDLMETLGRGPRYFHGGTKLDDIIEFILWRDLANKNGVILTNDVVDKLLFNSCHGSWWGLNLADASRDIQYSKLRATHNMTDASIRTAMRQEFGVQIAQMAMLARRSVGPDNKREHLANIQVSSRGDYYHIYLNTPFEVRIAPTPEQIGAQYRIMRTELTIDLLPVSLDALAKQVKLPDDPKVRLEALKDFYDKYARQQYNPANDTPGFTMPSRVEVQFVTAEAGMEYYRMPAKVAVALEKTPPTAFNALSPLAGAITWLAAPARWEAKLQQYVDAERGPFERNQHDFYQALVARNDRYLAETEPGKKIDAKLAYDLLASRSLGVYKNSASALTTPYFYSPGQYLQALESSKPTTAASLVAGASSGFLNGWLSYQCAAYDDQARKIAPMASRDSSKRAEIGGQIMMARMSELSGGSPFAAAGLTYYAGLQPQFLPVAGYLEKELQSKIEEDLSQRLVNTVMLDVKKQLEVIKGRDFAFPGKVDELQKQYSQTISEPDGRRKTVPGLIFGETSQPRTEYDIDMDPGLRLLRDSFYKERHLVNQIEGRAGKPEFLKDADFAKLFFGSEPIGVGALEPFFPKIWPPYVMAANSQQSLLAQKSLQQRLFDSAAMPFVFWKSKKLGPELMAWDPKDANRLQLIEEQYRLYEARSTIQQEVKKAAAEVKRAQGSEGQDLDKVMRDEAKKLSTDVITLSRVAKLAEKQDRAKDEPLSYGEYNLSRGLIPFARDDMVQQLLSLRHLKEPLKMEPEEGKQIKTTSGASADLAKTELGELDKLNADLFSSAIAANPKSNVGQVQVLTNKPRSIYYIATVVGVREPSTLIFFEGDILPQGWGKESNPTTFADQVQQTAGKELWREFVLQMRTSAGVDVSEQARKQFAEDTQGQ